MPRDRDGVRGRAKLERVDVERAVESGKWADGRHVRDGAGGVGVPGPAGPHKGAVLKDADQLDAAIALRGDDGVRSVVHLKHIRCARAVQTGKWSDGRRACDGAGGVGVPGPVPHKGAVLKDADQLDGVRVARGYDGVRLVANLECVDVGRRVKLGKARAAASRCEPFSVAACIDIDHMDAVVLRGGRDGERLPVRLVAKLERVDTIGPSQPTIEPAHVPRIYRPDSAGIGTA